MGLEWPRGHKLDGHGGTLAMTPHPSALDNRISRRQLLHGVTVGSGLALLALAGAATPAAAAAAGRLAAQPVGGREFHGAWP